MGRERCVQTFPNVAGNETIRFPRRGRPWRVRSITCEILPLVAVVIPVLRLTHAGVCYVWQNPGFALNVNIITQAMWAPNLPRADTVVGANNYSNASIPDAFIEPNDELTLFLQDGDPTDSINAIVLDFETL